jgi:hypothetical protein
MAKSTFGGRGSRKTTIKGDVGLDIAYKFTVKGDLASQFNSRLQVAVQRATSRVATELKAALDAALLSGVWSTPSGRGDIYETGELLSSGSVTVDGSGLKIAYDAPYATLVHFGGYINPYGNMSVRVYLPPRPWVEAVLQGNGPVPQFDFEKYYREELAREFNG